VDLYPCINNQKNQQWTFSGGQIIGVGSGKCLDVPGGSASNQQYLEIWACNGGTNQKWTLDNYGEASTAGLNCKGTSGWNNYGSAPTSYCAYAVKWVGYYGWPSNQSEVTCASSVYNYESGWRTTATNPKSGAYGIPQAYPGSKMASMGSDWQTNADTQIHWGISYMKSTYKSPCGAWSFEKANGWY
jgi:hypothetical protein